MIGKNLGHYEIVEKIGEGGMGAVYKARDNHLDRFVAIKVLPPEKVSDPQRKARFVQEAKAASALQHPNIIHIYDISSEDGTDYIAMEYVDGRTLDQLIPRKGMHLNEALKAAVQIADALARAHSAGIVHRDIKPSNVMIDQHGHVKVLDFGLAKLIENGISEEASTQTLGVITGEGTIIGTVAYMSPEQAEGKAVDSRSDIFSFGSVLYEMVTGQRAFQGDSKVSTLAAILKSEPKPAAQLKEAFPKELDRIISRCLRKDLEHRSQNIKEIRLELDEILLESESGGMAGAVGRKRWEARHLAIGAIALFVLTMAVAAYVVFHRGGHPGVPVKYTLRQLTSGSSYATLPAASPDGRYIAYVSDRSGHQDLWIQPTGGGDPVQLTNNSEPAIWPRFSPDGSRIIFYRRSGIYVVTLVGGKERRLLDEAWHPAFSPDGKWIAYASGYLKKEIRIMPADGGLSKKLYEAENVIIWGPLWAPDGSCLLIGEVRTSIGNATEYSDWKLLPVSGGNPVPVSGMTALRQQSTFYPYPKVWLPEPSQVIYGSGLRQSHIWRVRLLPDGRIKGPPEQLTSGTMEHPGPASRDGQVIPFSTGSRGSSIYSLPIDANRAIVQGEPTALQDWDVESYFPSVMDDGKKMVFVSERSGNFDLWMRDNVTKEESPLIATPLREIRGVLSRDGKKIAWQRYENLKRPIFLKELPEGGEKVICDDCQSVLGWTADNSGVLIDQGKKPRFFEVFETASGKRLPTAVDDRLNIANVAFSPDGKWFSFTIAPEKVFQGKLMVSPWRKDRPTRTDEWVQIGKEDEYHRTFWSPDGRMLYYFKYEQVERALCLFGWRFDPATGKPQGSEITVRHFHGDLRVVGVGNIGFGLTPNFLYLTMWASGGQVWVAEGSANEN